MSIGSDRMGIGSWAIVVALLGMLAGAGAIAYFGWTMEAGPPMPTELYVPMALGIVFSLIVGCGLMALVFYSSRKGYDEPPHRFDRE
jgi:ABC-type uncharacterized transport system permease subunit